MNSKPPPRASLEPVELNRPAARSHLAAIVEFSEDAIYSFTLDGLLSSWNHSAEVLYGYTEPEVMGRHVSMLMPEGSKGELARIDQTIRAGRALSRYRTQRLTKEGASVDVSITISPMMNADGEVVGASTITRDIAAVLQAESELRVANTQLRQTIDELKQFSYVASHDLREPLRTIRSFCELLERRYHDQLDEQANKWIGFMSDGAARMQDLIDDLLKYSRLETQNLPTSLTDIGQLLQGVTADMTALLDEAGAIVDYESLPQLVVDPVQITQLFQNLIGNAVKYRGEQPPRIRISADRVGQAWQFAVADNGIGIEAEFYGKIFELFKRLHGRDEYSGTGIGLAICRKIVHRHQGTIWVDSRPGQGSTFYFTIPDAVASPSLAPSRAES